MLTIPPLLDAKPGDPITSEGWNNLVVAIRNIYDAVTKAATLSIAVTDKADNSPLQGAVVTVKPSNESGGAARAGVFAGADVNQYLIDRLPPGTYTLTIEAQGYSPETRDVTMDPSGASQRIAVPLTALQVMVTMPSLFGKALNDAQTTVTQANLQVGRIITSHGTDVPPAAVPDDVKLSMVLNQFPDPGLQVPVNTPVQLEVSAKAEFTAQIKVPNLSGLTLAEAKAMLEANSLTLGLTSTAKGF